MKEILKSKIVMGFVLLILGKGHEEVMIVKDKKIPFNDHKVVEEILKKVEVR